VQPAAYHVTPAADAPEDDRPGSVPGSPVHSIVPVPSHEPDPFAGQRELKAEDVVRTVLERNPSLQQMEAAWAAARTRYAQATSFDDPMLSFQFAPASIASDETNFSQVTELSQALPYPGKRSLRGRQADEEADAAGYDVVDWRLRLTEAAWMAFGDYFEADRTIAINQQSIELLTQFRQLVADRYELKQATLQELEQATVELGMRRELALSLERRRQVARARLNTLMHRAPDAALPAPPPQMAVSEVLPPAVELRSRAIAARPDLRALERRIAAEEAAVELAMREVFPDFTLAASYDSMWDIEQQRASIGVAVNLPIRRDRRRAAVAERLAQVRQKRAELEARTDEIAQQVQETYERVLEKAKAVRVFERDILPASRRNVEAARIGYESTKEVTFLAWIEAQRSFVDQQARFYEAVAEYLRQRATLERVVAGAIP
jgi:outer membrane protein TolC